MELSLGFVAVFCSFSLYMLQWWKSLLSFAGPMLSCFVCSHEKPLSEKNAKNCTYILVKCAVASLYFGLKHSIIESTILQSLHYNIVKEKK